MKIGIFSLIIIIFLLIITLSSIHLPLHYLKYALPIVPVLFSLQIKKIKIGSEERAYFILFIVLYAIVVLWLLAQNALSSDISDRFFPNAIFILSPLLFIFFASPFFKESDIKQYLLLIFTGNAIIFFLEEGNDLWNVLTDLGALKEALLTSELPTENFLAFVFGFFVIYFFIEKYKIYYQIIAIVLFILCFKRIVIVAVVVCVFAYVCIKIFRMDISRHRKKWTIIAVLVNISFIKITQLLVSGTFDETIFRLTGFSTDRFLMGRQTFYEMAFNAVGDYSWSGIGLGKIDDIILFSYGQKMNLHSEILKNYFEFGIILFLVWMILFVYKNLFSNKAAIFFLYINILMLTDNVFIYFDIMFYFYLFILIYLREQSSQGNIENHSYDKEVFG